MLIIKIWSQYVIQTISSPTVAVANVKYRYPYLLTLLEDVCMGPKNPEFVRFETRNELEQRDGFHKWWSLMNEWMNELDLPLRRWAGLSQPYTGWCWGSCSDGCPPGSSSWAGSEGTVSTGKETHFSRAYTEPPSCITMWEGRNEGIKNNLYVGVLRLWWFWVWG